MYKYDAPKKRSIPYLIVSLVVALLLIGIGIYVKHNQINIYIAGVVLSFDVISLFIMVVGASVLVLSLTNGILIKETEDELICMLEDKINKAQRTQINFLKHSFSVTSQALMYGLEDILSPRYKVSVDDEGEKSIELNTRTYEKIAEHLHCCVKNFIHNPPTKDEKDRILLVNGITLKDFSDAGNPLSNYINTAIKELGMESRKRKLGNRKFIIRALALSPQASAVNFRKSFIGESNPSAGQKEIKDFFQQYPLQNNGEISSQTTERRLKSDIEYSIRSFKNLQHTIESKKSAIKLELRETAVLPPAYFIITDDYLFI